MRDEQQGAGARRTMILDAAESSFARRGFHRCTMQDVAAEAQMSPGNLYRYFASKEALVEGLTERDRAKFMQDFEALEHAPPSIELLETMARAYLLDEPREKKILELEIWAESTRNPALAAICQQVQHDVDGHLLRYLVRLRDAGIVAADVVPEQALATMSFMVEGFVVRIATDPSFDAAGHIAVLFAVFRAVLRGDMAHRPPVEAAA